MVLKSEKFGQILVDSIELKNEHQFRHILDDLKVNTSEPQKALGGLTIFEKVLETPNTRTFIELCLKNGSEFYAKNSEGIYPLRYAINSLSASNLTTILLSSSNCEDEDNEIQHSMIVNQKLAHDKNYLHFLIERLTEENYDEVSEMIKVLLKNNCSPNSPNDQLETPFCALLIKLRTFSIDSDLVEFFIKNAHIDFHSFKSDEIIALMKEFGLESEILNQELNKDVNFMLRLLEQWNERKFVDEFASFKSRYQSASDLKNDFATLLETAVVRNMQKAVTLLLTNGANVSGIPTNSKCKIPAAFIACRFGHHEVLSVLLCDASLKFEWIHSNLLHQVCYSSKVDASDRQKCFDMLIADRRCSPQIINGLDYQKHVPLFYACQNGFDEVATELLRRGASIDHEAVIDNISREVLSEFLDECIKSSKDVRDKNCEIHIDFRCLVPMDANDKMHSEVSSVRAIAESPLLNELVLHPVISSFLHLKWRKIKWPVYFNLLVYFCFMMFLGYFIINYFHDPVYNNYKHRGHKFHRVNITSPRRGGGINNNDIDMRNDLGDETTVTPDFDYDTTIAEDQPVRSTTPKTRPSSTQHEANDYIPNDDVPPPPAGNAGGFAPPAGAFGPVFHSDVKPTYRPNSTPFTTSTSTEGSAIGQRIDDSVSDTAERQPSPPMPSTPLVPSVVRQKQDGAIGVNPDRFSPPIDPSTTEASKNNEKKPMGARGKGQSHRIPSTPATTTTTEEPEIYDDPPPIWGRLWSFGGKKRNKRSTTKSWKQEFENHMDENVISYRICVVGVLLMTLYEVVQCVASYKKYFFKLSNWLDIIMICLAYKVLLDSFDIEPKDFKRIRAVTILVMAAQSIQLIAKISILSMSLHMAIFKRVCATFLKTIALYLILILAFAMSFYTMDDSDEKKSKDDLKYLGSRDHKKSDDDDENLSFSNPFISVITTVRMMLSDFDTFKLDENDQFQGFIFLLFVILITVVLFNLLNALAISDTNNILKDAELVDTKKRISILVTYEKIYQFLSLTYANIFPEVSAITIAPNKSNNIKINNGSSDISEVKILMHKTGNVQKLVDQCSSKIMFWKQDNRAMKMGSKMMRKIVEFVKLQRQK